MTDRTRRALKSASRAALWMAGLAVFNVLVYRQTAPPGFWYQVAPFILAPVLTFVLLGSLFFALGYADDSARTDTRTSGRWTRPFSKTQTLAAYLVAGWFAALLIFGIVNYLVSHRPPTRSELGFALVIAVPFGVIIALIAAFYVAHIRWVGREFGRDEKEQADSEHAA